MRHFRRCSGQPAPAATLSFAVVPAGWDGGWHASPRRQFALVLGGEAEVETSDGVRRRIRPGDAWLIEDTTGKGHALRTPAGLTVALASLAG